MFQKIKQLFERGILSNNQLKIIGIITMTIDHIGVYLFPQYEILRIIGRLAFPIFAYMIAEGCAYTKNRRRYLGTLCLVAVLYQVVYYVLSKSLYMGIFVTFSFSVAFIYVMDYARNKGGISGIITLLASFAVIAFATIHLPHILHGFLIDYGFAGAMLPALVYGVKTKRDKLFMLSLGLVLLSGIYGGVQWYSLFALPLIALYNQKRGKIKMKSFFYIYYPLHLVAIYGIDLLV